MTPRLSVVIPAYNSAAFIEETVESVLGQTFDDFELIISDHSSTDGTWERLQRFAGDPRVTLSRLPAGGGAPANWNAVTRGARGELLKLVCGDDLLRADCLATQVAALDAHAGAVMVASTRNVIDARGDVVIRGRGLPGLNGPVDGREAIRRTVRAGTNIFGEPAAVLLRRSPLMEEGLWDDRFPYLIDQASYVRVLLHGSLVAIREPLAGFRVSAEQWSVQLMRSQAEQARGFHRRLAAEHPGLLTTRDLWTGDVMATGMALARRAAYLWLGRRMTAAPRG